MKITRNIAANAPLFVFYTMGPHKVTTAPAMLSCLKLAHWYLSRMLSRCWLDELSPVPKLTHEGRLASVAYGRAITAQWDTTASPRSCSGTRHVALHNNWRRREAVSLVKTRWNCTVVWLAVKQNSPMEVCRGRKYDIVLPGRPPGPRRLVVLQEK